jgi:periplasmic divalent cation tolerance protein
MADYYDIYVTTRDEAEAKKIGETLVAERLAACANIHPIGSIYCWRGEIERASEAALLLKTRADLVSEVIIRVRALHSYEVPCIIATPIETGNPTYLKWISESTR